MFKNAIYRIIGNFTASHLIAWTKRRIPVAKSRENFSLKTFFLGVNFRLMIDNLSNLPTTEKQPR